MTEYEIALQHAIEQWRQALGPSAIRTDETTIRRYARTTGPAETRPGAVLYPSRTADVQKIVGIAGKFNTPLYPISRGKNWGYGDACAPTDGQVILDLQRMDRIVKVNPELAYAIIEPGVSQGQLYQYLKTHHSDLWMDVTGAGPDASVAGNTLDRGFGHTPCGDHFHNAAGFEVVLSDQRILRTGYGGYPNAHATPCYRYGIGPSLEGLFTQSNLGIVTQLTIWLNRRPAAMEAFFVTAPNRKDLPDLIDRLAPLRLTGLLQSAVHVANDLRVMSSRVRHPGSDNGKPITPEQRNAIRRSLRIGSWSVTGATYGTHATVRATRKAIKGALRGYQVIFLNDMRLRRARQVFRWLNWFGMAKTFNEQLNTAEPAYDLLKGKPRNDFLRGVLWQASDPAVDTGESLDPLDHNVGLIWVSPVVPADGGHADAVLELMEPIYAQYEFDLPVTLTFVTERALCVVSNITFDRRSPQQSRRAQQCHEALLNALIAGGYPPYRTGPDGFRLIRNDSVFWKTCQQLKQTLDPMGIISPGRYIG